MVTNRKKAVVVGASSGIGRQLAKVLSHNGYQVGLASRRVHLLNQLQREIPAKTFVKQIDLTQTERAVVLLEELIREMGGIDLIVLNAGINRYNPNLEWEKELETIDVNVSGFVACAGAAIKHFLSQKSGHIAGISSIAGLRGSASCPSYNASKAFVSNYLQGLRYRLRGNNIHVTDIRPGLVDTPMIKSSSRLFWVVSANQAAEQVYQAIKKRKKIAYITRRWLIMAWLIKALPDWIYNLRFKLENRTK